MGIRNADQLINVLPKTEPTAANLYFATDGSPLTEEEFLAKECSEASGGEWILWGEQAATEGAGRYIWTGLERGAETALQLNRTRCFDPKAGRWVSQEPLAFDFEDSNLYRFYDSRSSGPGDREAAGRGYA